MAASVACAQCSYPQHHIKCTSLTLEGYHQLPGSMTQWVVLGVFRAQCCRYSWGQRGGQGLVELCAFPVMADLVQPIFNFVPKY